MTAAGHAFGRRLREAREHKGIALEAVAESTKIKMSLLASLERGDVSQWPGGIFRRAFVREYAAAIGLQPATVLAEFSRLFPEEGGADADAQPAEPREVEGGLRLTLAADETPLNRAMIANVLAAGLDFAALLGLAASITLFTGTGFWATSGIAGLIYYSVATAWLGRSVASWWLDGRLGRHGRAAVSGIPQMITPDRFQIVSRRRDSLASVGLARAETAANLRHVAARSSGGASTDSFSPRLPATSGADGLSGSFFLQLTVYPQRSHRPTAAVDRAPGSWRRSNDQAFAAPTISSSDATSESRHTPGQLIPAPRIAQTESARGNRRSPAFRPRPASARFYGRVVRYDRCG